MNNSCLSKLSNDDKNFILGTNTIECSGSNNWKHKIDMKIFYKVCVIKNISVKHYNKQLFSITKSKYSINYTQFDVQIKPTQTTYGIFCFDTYENSINYIYELFDRDSFIHQIYNNIFQVYEHKIKQLYNFAILKVVSNSYSYPKMIPTNINNFYSNEKLSEILYGPVSIGTLCCDYIIIPSELNIDILKVIKNKKIYLRKYR